MDAVSDDLSVDRFIARWTANAGGAERANYALFLTELCDLLGVPHPDPASSEREFNDYVFERGVRRRDSEAIASTLRIDLYKKGCFILEAKQSRLPGAAKSVPGQPAASGEAEAIGRRSSARNWDALMANARRQAEDYVFRLEVGQPAPLFLIVCDVGHCFEIYADFSGTGRAYGQFPDRQSFRIYLESLREPALRERLAAIWLDPQSLNPARKAAEVTREIADRLAQVSRALEKRHPPEEVAHFLMRCIFTMFAEDVDLLPRGQFTALVEECLDAPQSFAPLLEDLWARMDAPDSAQRFYSAFKQRLRHFNGNLFHQARAFPLDSDDIRALLAAARHDWTKVEPAIFGTLLERALDPKERGKLGAHYTPRAYVERLVQVAVMEPLRADWRDALLRVQDAVESGRPKDAVDFARRFHDQLCKTRVLDPACGTGNFLYVALELMKALEGEVLEKLAELGFERLGLETVDPHQFLGLELNPRAAAIAELVVWIGYLQQHYRTNAGHPSEPILRAFHNINFGGKTGFDAVLTWDGYPLPTVAVVDGRRGETYPNARRPEWPEAEFIVGNPPFIGGKDVRSELGSGYAETLWAVHRDMNDSADFVMYWWDRAADILTRPGSRLRRFGFITTNSITQVFQRRVTERWLKAKRPLSLVFAIADHPWTKATRDSAAVRIAMTVAQAGAHEGEVLEVVSEAGLDTDAPAIGFDRLAGRINSDLTVGVDVTQTKALLANEGVCSPGVKLHGAGFIVKRSQAEHLGLGKRAGLERHMREYRNGRDLTARGREVLVLDLYGLSEIQVRQCFPEVYDHVTDHVRYDYDADRRPKVDGNGRKIGREWNAREIYREKWWIFGEPRSDLRAALTDQTRYIATVETAKHRIFQFLDASILPDNMIVAVATEDAAILSVLSSRIHTSWAPRVGGWLGFGNDPRYSKSRCFDPFPFPEPTPAQRNTLRLLGEELDLTRKQALAENPDLTLTGLYNVLEKLRAGAPLDAADEDVKTRGRVLILRELHARIDDATADAYGWPRALSDDEILARLVALNAERAAEEAAGHVRWLRPDYQAPRFGKAAPGRTGEFALGDVAAVAVQARPAFPKDRYEQPLAVKAALASASQPLSSDDIARLFKGSATARKPRIEAILTVLARYGDAVRLGDGRYVARWAATA